MYTKIINYKDYAGKSHQETLNFELSVTSILTMHYSLRGGLVAAIDACANDDNPSIMIAMIKLFVIESYGKLNKSKTEFDKSPKVKEKFLKSKAYDTFMQILLKDGDEFVNFLDGIIPEEVKNSSKEKNNPFNMNLDLDLKNLNKKTIFDDLEELGFKLRGEE